jgi:hypothetical protein
MSSAFGVAVEAEKNPVTSMTVAAISAPQDQEWLGLYGRHGIWMILKSE